jgi:hypothetical protein
LDAGSTLIGAGGPKTNNITQFFKDRHIAPETWTDYPVKHNNVTIHLEFENNSGDQVTVHTYDPVIEAVYGEDKDGRLVRQGIMSTLQFNE